MSFRETLRTIKYRLAPPIEALWHPAIGWLSRTDRAAPAQWSSPGGQCVLVLAPHPDDEAMGCVGTLLRHVDAGDRVCIAIATDGRRSQAVSDPNEMARVRHAEAADAARLMGAARLEWIGLPEGAWQVQELAHRLRALLAELRPDVIYAPSRVDFHPEHLAVAHSLALALDSMSHAPLVRIYQVQVPLTASLTNLVCDVSALRVRWEPVLGAYHSQRFTVACAHRLRRYAGATLGRARWLEPFWELEAQRYVALHLESPARWPRSFRGLRTFPLSDPLAWLGGRAERRRLAGI